MTGWLRYVHTGSRVHHDIYGYGKVEKITYANRKTVFLVRFDSGCLVDLYDTNLTAV